MAFIVGNDDLCSERCSWSLLVQWPASSVVQQRLWLVPRQHKRGRLANSPRQHIKWRRRIANWLEILQVEHCEP